MRKKFVFTSIILLAAVFLGGCTGAVAWPGLSASGDVAYLANTNTVYAVDAKSSAMQYFYLVRNNELMEIKEIASQLAERQQWKVATTSLLIYFN